MYHKYIFLDVNWIFDLVQTLLFEELYVENKQLSPERELLIKEQEERRNQEPREREQKERDRYFIIVTISLFYVSISFS